MGTTQLPNTSIRISVNGIAKTIVTTDENGMFTYNSSKFIVGDVIRVEMKANGSYTGAKEVTVMGNE